MTEEAINEYWDARAKEFGASDLATAPDHAYRELEIKSIIPHIKGFNVLDIGCGNGYSTFKFREAHKNKQFIGVDYSQAMIREAAVENITRHSDILFMTGDVRHLNMSSVLQFDTIISERCLINLQTWEDQKQALLEMKKHLAPGGRIILVENFIDGLRALNNLRALFDLHEIKTRWHNRYLVAEEFFNFVPDHFAIDYSENIGNLYYIISRVVYAALAKAEGKEPEYSNPINYLAAKLPSLGQNYSFSPNTLLILSII